MTTISRNEKGLSQILIAVIIVIVVIGAGGIIWQATKKSTSPNISNTSTTASTKTASNAAVSSACLKAYNNDRSLCAFAEHTNISTKQYIATGTATNKTGTKSTYTVQNDGNGNTEVTYSTNGQQLSSISLDGSTYIQEGKGGTWLEYSGSALGTATSVPNPTSGFNLNFTTSTPAGVSVTKEGTVSCENLSCYKYKVVDSSTPTATEYVYFDTNDYLLRQWTSNDTSSGISVDLNFSYPTVTISKPSPVQQIST